MTEPDHQGIDRLSPQTIHELTAILTALRGQEHMVRRWVRLRSESDGFEEVLERLAATDSLILRLAAELRSREVGEDGELKDVR